MCLVIKKNARIKKAKKDIPVYKLVLHEDKKFLTPCQSQEVELGNTYETDGVFKAFNPEQDERVCNDMAEDEVYVEAGLFHSFLDKEEAETVYKMYKNVGYKPVLVNCTIPKGAKYLTGWCKFQRTYIFGMTIEKHVCKSIGSTIIRYDSIEKFYSVTQN